MINLLTKAQNLKFWYYYGIWTPKIPLFDLPWLRIFDSYRRIRTHTTWPKQAIGHENIEPSVNAYVYSIRYYNTREPTLTICVSGNRFCLNVNRRHKSNNIMFVIDIVNFCFTQRCHDDMCRGYESPSFNLPPEIFFSTQLERKNN